MTSIAPEAPTAAAPTFWETAADTRWGNYITEIERTALLAAHAAFPKPGAGLEVGCEGGRWSRMLADLGWQMTATDVDAAVLDVCQARNPSVHCVLVSPDDQQFPVGPASVDLLLCLEVPPVVNQSWFFAEAARVVKPGGKLVGNLNNLLSWRGAAVKLKSTLGRRRQFYATTYPAFRRSLRAHGFTIDAAQGCCWPPFGRHSDSRLVPLATGLEQTFGLQRLPSISPWVVYTATLK